MLNRSAQSLSVHIAVPISNRQATLLRNALRFIMQINRRRLIAACFQDAVSFTILRNKSVLFKQ